MALHGQGVLDGFGEAEPLDDPSRDLIENAIQDLRESPEQTSIAIGQPAGWLRGYLRAPHRLPGDLRRRLAMHLGLPEQALR